MKHTLIVFAILVGIAAAGALGIYAGEWLATLLVEALGLQYTAMPKPLAFVLAMIGTFLGLRAAR